MSGAAPAAVPGTARARVLAVGAADSAVFHRVAIALRAHAFETHPDTQVMVLIADRSAGRRADAVRELRSRLPSAKIIVVAPADAGRLWHTLDAGADGIVLEPEIEVTLGPTVTAVAAGQVVVPRRRRAEIQRPALTQREKQTLVLAAGGLTNHEIAGRLYLAESTVKTHMTAVFAKLGVHSRAEAAALALDPDEARVLGLASVHARRA